MGELRRASEVRQAELVDAALRLIATRGIAALTTRALAEAVGLSSGAIFRHFASLEELLGAVVTRVEEVVDATFPAATAPPLERLQRFITARSAAVGKQLGILRLVLSEQFLLSLPPGASTRLAACVRRTHAFVVECVRQGQLQGQLRDDLPAEALAPIVMGTIQMLALSSASGRQRAADATAVRAALLTLLAPCAPALTRASAERDPS